MRQVHHDRDIFMLSDVPRDLEVFKRKPYCRLMNC